MNSEPRINDEPNYGIVEIENVPLDEDPMWDAQYPIGVKSYIYAGFLLDTFIAVTSGMLIVLLKDKNEFKEELWISVNGILLFLYSYIRFTCSYGSPHRYLALVTLRTRLYMFIPQILFTVWCFMSVYFFTKKASGILHVWFFVILVYSYVLSFVIIVDCVLAIFFLVFLSRSHVELPALDRVSELLYRTKYCEEFTTKDDACSICLSKYCTEDTLVYLPCSGYHHYHEKCIIEWLKRNSVCPVCKMPITEQCIESTPINQERLKSYFKVLNVTAQSKTMPNH